MSRKGENIYKRKDGRWEGRLAIEILGKKHYKSVYGRSYKEVKNKMMAFMQKPNCPTIGKIDFKSASEEWINQAKPRVKESTIKNYTYLLKKHILPFFGNINMADISL